MVDLNISLPENFLEEEVRCEYTISSDMKKVWAVEMDLLAKLLEVCEKHDIRIWGCAGTILGAKRHGGFIPWDDDIDMMILRKDYERLCKIAPQEFTGNYFFQTEYTDPGSLRGHAQLRNSATTAVLRTEEQRRYKFNQGIFIDIFPLDYIPADYDDYLNELIAQRKKAMWLGNRTTRLTFDKDNKKLSYKLKFPFMRLFAWIYKAFKIKNKQYIKYEQLMQKYDDSCPLLGMLALYNQKGRFFWNKEDLEGVEYLDYENIKLPVPKGYIHTLEKTYGEWQRFVVGGSVHGDVIFDTDKSYKDYYKQLG